MLAFGLNAPQQELRQIAPFFYLMEAELSKTIDESESQYNIIPRASSK